MRNKINIYSTSVILAGFFNSYFLKDDVPMHKRVRMSIYCHLKDVIDMNIDDFDGKNITVSLNDRRKLQNFWKSSFGFPLGMRFSPNGDLTLTLDECTYYIESTRLSGLSSLNKALYNLIWRFICDFSGNYRIGLYQSSVDKIKRTMEEDISYISKLGYNVLSAFVNKTELDIELDKSIDLDHVKEIIKIFKYRSDNTDLMPNIKFQKSDMVTDYGNGFQIEKNLFNRIIISDYFERF